MSDGNRSDMVPVFFTELGRLALTGSESIWNDAASTFVGSHGQPYRHGLKHKKCIVITSTATRTPATSGQDVERILDNDRVSALLRHENKKNARRFALPARENKKVHVVLFSRRGRTKKCATCPSLRVS